jgi:hypothetical protein
VRKALVFGSLLVAFVGVAFPAGAATWYVSPGGTATSDCSTRETPCSLSSAASGAVAGDTVILTDGVYNTNLYVANSGTESAWITFKADECSTPILEGPGVGPADDDQTMGVGSNTATYLRFDGIVSRGWNTGFGNGWTGSHTPDSNGNWEIENCIGDMNGRTGFTFYSGQGFKLKHSIAAHNGTSTAHSWSSGVTLYSSPGGTLVEGNVSFENIDAENHTDGSGFIADEASDGAIFINNLAFGNGGSCLRLTRSLGTKFVNNTCYHNAQDPLATGPSDPDELYFTNAPGEASTVTDIWFANNALVALGTGHGPKTSNYVPTDGWSNNASALGTVTYFTDADGENPNFAPAASATTLLGMGSRDNAPPDDDLGFDPKCLVKRAPTMIGMMDTGSWWQHSIDYEYIKSIGGVARCFNPKPRSGTPDIGSYAKGAIKTATPNNCTPPPVGDGSGEGGADAGGASAGGASDGGSPVGDAAAAGSRNPSLPKKGKAASFCSVRHVGSADDPSSMMGVALLGAVLWGSRRRNRETPAVGR